MSTSIPHVTAFRSVHPNAHSCLWPRWPFVFTRYLRPSPRSLSILPPFAQPPRLIPRFSTREQESRNMHATSVVHRPTMPSPFRLRMFYSLLFCHSTHDDVCSAPTPMSPPEINIPNPSAVLPTHRDTALDHLSSACQVAKFLAR